MNSQLFFLIVAYVILIFIYYLSSLLDGKFCESNTMFILFTNWYEL